MKYFKKDQNHDKHDCCRNNYEPAIADMEKINKGYISKIADGMVGKKKGKA